MDNMNERISTRRKELGLTLDEVAAFVGVNKGTVSRWESGEIDNLRRDKIAKLAEVLKVSPLFIMGMKDAVPASVSDQHSPRDLNDLARFLNKTEIMFDGDTYCLDEDDRQKLRNALEFVFWDAKQQNKRKKKAPKKITGADSSTREETPDTAALIGKKILAASSKAQVAIDQIIRNDEKE